MAGIETTLTNIATFLETVAPTLSLILIVLGGLAYGLSYTQPPEARGKWQNTAMGLFIGGIIVGVIVGAATIIRDMSMQALQ